MDTTMDAVVNAILVECDPQNSGQAKVMEVINFIAPFLQSNISELSELEYTLKENSNNAGIITRDAFIETMKMWTAKYKESGSSLEDSFETLLPGSRTFDTNEKSFVHSTPRTSLGILNNDYPLVMDPMNISSTSCPEVVLNRTIFEDRIKELEHMNYKLSRAVERHKLQSLAYDEQVEELKQKVELLTNQFNIAQHLIDSFNKEQSIKEDSKIHDNENDELCLLQNKYVKLQIDNDKMVAQNNNLVDEMENEKQMLGDRIFHLEEQIMFTKTEIDKMENVVTEKTNMIETLSDANTALVNTNIELTAIISELNTIIDTFRSEQTTMERKLRKSLCHNDKLQTSFSALQSLKVIGQYSESKNAENEERRKSFGNTLTKSPDEQSTPEVPFTPPFRSAKFDFYNINSPHIRKSPTKDRRSSLLPRSIAEERILEEEDVRTMLNSSSPPVMYVVYTTPTIPDKTGEITFDNLEISCEEEAKYCNMDPKSPLKSIKTEIEEIDDDPPELTTNLSCCEEANSLSLRKLNVLNEDNEIDALKKRISELNQEIANLNSILDDRRILEEQLTTQDDMLHEKTTECDNLNKILSDNLEIIANLEKSEKLNLHAIRNFESEFQNLEAILRKANVTKATLATKLADLENLEVVKASNKALYSEITSRKRKEGKLLDENNSLKRNIKMLEKDNSDLQKTNEQICKELTEQLSDINDMQSVLDSVKSDLDTLKGSLYKLYRELVHHMEIKDVDENIRSLEFDMKSLTDLVFKLLEFKTSATLAIDQLQKRDLEHTKYSERLMQELKSLQQQIQANEQRHASSLCTEFPSEVISTNTDKGKGTFGRLKTRLEKYQNQLELRTEELYKERQLNESTKSHLRDYELTINKLNSNNKNVKQQINSLNQNLILEASKISEIFKEETSSIPKVEESLQSVIELGSTITNDEPDTLSSEVQDLGRRFLCIVAAFHAFVDFKMDSNETIGGVSSSSRRQSAIDIRSPKYTCDSPDSPSVNLTIFNYDVQDNVTILTSTRIDSNDALGRVACGSNIVKERNEFGDINKASQTEINKLIDMASQTASNNSRFSTTFPIMAILFLTFGMFILLFLSFRSNRSGSIIWESLFEEVFKTYFRNTYNAI